MYFAHFCNTISNALERKLYLFAWLRRVNQNAIYARTSVHYLQVTSPKVNPLIKHPKRFDIRMILNRRCKIPEKKTPCFYFTLRLTIR